MVTSFALSVILASDQAKPENASRISLNDGDSGVAFDRLRLPRMTTAKFVIVFAPEHSTGNN